MMVFASPVTWKVSTPPEMDADGALVPGDPEESVVPEVREKETVPARPLARKRHVWNLDSKAVPAVPPTVAVATRTNPVAMVFSSTWISVPRGAVASVAVASIVSAERLNVEKMVSVPLPVSVVTTFIPKGEIGPGVSPLVLGTGSCGSVGGYGGTGSPSSESGFCQRQTLFSSS